MDDEPAAQPWRPGDDGKDPVIAMVSINLPIWWDKLAAGVREARYRYLSALRKKEQKANWLKNFSLKLR